MDENKKQVAIFVVFVIFLIVFMGWGMYISYLEKKTFIENGYEEVHAGGFSKTWKKINQSHKQP